jgi:hypothetical protein
MTAGTMINVGISWARALALEDDWFDRARTFSFFSVGDGWLAGVVEDFGVCYVAAYHPVRPWLVDWPERHPPAWSYLTELPDIDAPAKSISYSDTAFGWPSLALRRSSIEGNATTEFNSVRVNGTALPVRPIWPGFATNSLLLALLFWVLSLALLLVRRDLRGRRGLCQRCAYPMGACPRCSECGYG